MALFVLGDTHLSLGGSKPMDVFPGWNGYVERLEANWRKLVKPEDTIVLAGDISWAMRLTDTRRDFEFLQQLPGQKLIMKGNHDYWWTTANKMNAYLKAEGFDTLHILHNNSYSVEGYAICGTRGWLFDVGEPHDEKVMNREIGRLKMSLDAAEPGLEKLVFLHYPPVYTGTSAPEIVATLKAHGNTCPVMLSSSIQATLIGRYGKSDYGKSKLAGEELFFEYSKTTGAPVLVYRFPNLFGKWCRPNYNSAVATFCHNIANGLPITVNDRATELELLYIDDLVEEMLDALEAAPHRCNYDGLTPVPAVDGRYCFAPVTHKVTLGEIVDLLEQFHAQPATLVVPEIPAGSFAKKLYSTYLSYLPKERIAFPLKVNADERGSFTELLKTENCGQFSVNISKPGITKGQHWHNTKWEFFIVVSGHGLIQERKVGCDEVMEFEVWGDKPTAVQMLPGCTHNIINLSDTENLVTLMWANEPFDPAKPDTFFLKV